MLRTSLPGGIGAVGSAMARFFHPSKPIRNRCPHDQKCCLTGVLVTGKAVHKISKKDQMCYKVCIMEINDGTKFFIVKKNFKVEQRPTIPFESEGPQELAVPPISAPNIDAEWSLDRIVVTNIVSGLSRTVTREEINELQRQEIEVDDDNEPASKNVPAPQEALPPDRGTWEKPIYCFRCAGNFKDLAWKFSTHRWDMVADYNEFQLFRMCFPKEWLVNVVIPMTNKELSNKMSLQEFYVFLGCIFFMVCYDGITDRDLWWSLKPVDMFERALFHLNAYMTRNQFKEIIQSIHYMDKIAPLIFVDCFHEVHQMIDAFNDHYAIGYRPSWLNCINESMNIWLNKFCPGFMPLPFKPHPFGNQYHSIADGDGGKPIMWRVKIIEGKDSPKKADGSWAFPSKWEQMGFTKKVNLLLEIKPIHHMGKIVIGNSGFFIADGVIALHKKGVHDQFLIMKQKYWPKLSLATR
jgi:hypothetical protein